MRIILVGLGMLVMIAGSAQNIIDVDKNPGRLPARELYATGGFPLNSAKYIKIASGSPYLSEKWMRGALATADSVEYGNLRLKLDLLDNSVIYLNDKNEEMICSTPVSKITMRDSASGKTYYFISGSSIPGAESVNTWYEVLTSGKVTLYKQHFKDIYETKPYGSSVTEQNIRSSERYFVQVGNSFSRIKKPKDIVDLVPDKKKQVSDFINNQKLSGKKETDYIQTVELYNSLP